MFDLLWVLEFIKIGANFSVGTKFAGICNFGSRSAVPSTIFKINMFDLHEVPIFLKAGAHGNFETKSTKFWVKIRNFLIIYLRLTNLSKFHSIKSIFHFWDQIFLEWGIEACFNAKCMLIGHNFEFFGGYLVVTACYLVVTVRYCSLPGGYCSLPLVSARFHF